MTHDRARTPIRLACTAAAALVLAAGCASGPGAGRAGGETRSPSSATASGASEQPGGGTTQGARPSQSAQVTIQEAVRDGEVTPAPRRVKIKQGQTVRLTVRSDTPDHVHVHGYDIEKPVRPSHPAVFTFTADQVGVFEVETHESGLQLLQLQVQ